MDFLPRTEELGSRDSETENIDIQIDIHRHSDIICTVVFTSLARWLSRKCFARFFKTNTDKK